VVSFEEEETSVEDLGSMRCRGCAAVEMVSGAAFEMHGICECPSPNMH
jgi:hypothetical protein